MSSPVEIGQEVLAAQGQIVKHCAKRYGIRAAFVVIALIFLAFAAVSFHGVLWALFFDLCHFRAFYSALCVLGADVFIAIICLLLALRSRIPGLAEEKARMNRDRKFQEFKQSVALSAVLGVVGGPVGRFAGSQALKIIRSMFSKK